MKNFTDRNNMRSGQVIIEAVVALSILSVGFLGMFSLLSQSLGLNRVVSDSYIANYLAAEGVELMRNYGENFAISTGNNSLGVFAGCSPDCTFEVDTSLIPVSVPVAGPFRKLRLDAITDLYGYSAGGVATPFERSIVVTSDPSGDFYKVVSEVRWITRGGDLTRVAIEDRLYGWR